MEPSRKFVDLNFWLPHIIGLALFFISNGSNKQTMSITESLVSWGLIFLFLITFVGYFFSIGRYAEKFGKRRTAWSGVSFLLMPLGFWGSYICSFFFKHKQ